MQVVSNILSLVLILDYGRALVIPAHRACPCETSRRIPHDDPSWLRVRGGGSKAFLKSLALTTALRSSASPPPPPSDFLTRNENLKGIVFMALSALSFSLMFLGVKLYSNAPTFTLVFYRSIVQAVLSLLVLLRTDKEGKSPLGPPDFRGLLIARGTFGSLAVAAFFYAIQKLPLPDAITLQFLTPVFAALLAAPLLGESWKRLDQIGAAVCLSGVLLIARPSWLFGATSVAAGVANGSASSFPTVIGLIGAALAALAYVLVRKIGTRADANVMVLYYAVISGVTAPIGQKLLGGSDSWNVLGNPTPTELVVFAGLGVFGFLGQLLTNMGLTKCESAATATLVTNTQIVFAFLFEVMVLHESLSPWSLAGTALIVGFMVSAGLSKMSKEVETESSTKG